MEKRRIHIRSIRNMVLMMAAVIWLTGCTYQPPYKRGYNEGYAAGYSDGSSGAPEAVKADTTETTVSSDEKKEEGDKESRDKEKAGKETVKEETAGSKETEKSKDDKPAEQAEDTASEAAGGAMAESDGAETAGADGAAESSEASEGAAPASGGATKDWGGRIIRAEAVNEAMYSNPEVIEGLREIYDDRQIFGEFVGDSGTNQLHKVGGPHFSSLTFEELVVFDETKSVEDIINEGFYTKCSCMD